MDDLSQVKISRRDVLIAGALSATATAVPSVSNAQGSAGAANGAAGAPPVLAKVSLLSLIHI